jgi:hypothetical protein
LRRDFQTSTGVKSASASAVTDVGLQDPTLLRDACYVGGQWVGASSGAVIDVTNPGAVRYRCPFDNTIIPKITSFSGVSH